MIHIFLRTLRYMRGLAGTRRASENHAEEEKRWRCDPLSHPALRHKNERQLADLPIGPARGGMPVTVGLTCRRKDGSSHNCPLQAA